MRASFSLLEEERVNEALCRLRVALLRERWGVLSHSWRRDVRRRKKYGNTLSKLGKIVRSSKCLDLTASADLQKAEGGPTAIGIAVGTTWGRKGAAGKRAYLTCCHAHLWERDVQPGT